MKILFITGKDGSNQLVENVLRELSRRGHEIAIYSNYKLSNSSRLYQELSIPVQPMKELTSASADPFDFCFVVNQSLNKKEIFLNKYFFSFPHRVLAVDHVRGSDFVFTQNELKEPYYGNFAYMPVGNPKNDTVSKTDSAPNQSKRILFIDSGHFPFSRKGKLQVAGMILEICRRFPDYEICVKPRWLPGEDSKEMSHINKWHLYDFIEYLSSTQEQVYAGGRIPKNLNLLKEHLDLQELIDSSRSVVTLHTSTYLDVALRGKGLISVKGIDSEDEYNLREAYINRYYAYMEESGCVVDYHDICKFLPDGLYCRPEHLEDAFIYRGQDVSKRVVSVMEYIHEHFLSRGVCPKIKAYRYETYQKEMREMPNFTWEKLKRNRYYNLAEGLIAPIETISIDWSDYIQQTQQYCAHLSPDAKDYSATLTELKKLKYAYLAAHGSELWPNDVDRSFYFSALYYTGRKEELLRYLRSDAGNHIALKYYCGLIYHERGKYFEASECLDAYLKWTVGRAFLKYREESNDFRRTGLLALLDCYCHLEQWENLFRLLLYCLTDSCFRPGNPASREAMETYRAVVREHCGDLIDALDEIKKA